MLQLTVWSNDGRFHEVCYLPTGRDIIEYLIERHDQRKLQRRFQEKSKGERNG